MLGLNAETANVWASMSVFSCRWPRAVYALNVDLPSSKVLMDMRSQCCCSQSYVYYLVFLDGRSRSSKTEPEATAIDEVNLRFGKCGACRNTRETDYSFGIFLRAKPIGLQVNWRYFDPILSLCHCELLGSGCPGKYYGGNQHCRVIYVGAILTLHWS